LRINEAASYRFHHGLGPRRRAQFDPGIIGVKIDCPLGQTELARNFSGNLAARH